MYHRPGSVYNLREFSVQWLQYEAWCQSREAQVSYKSQRLEQKSERRREKNPAAHSAILHGADDTVVKAPAEPSQATLTEVKTKVPPKAFCPYCDKEDHYLNPLIADVFSSKSSESCYDMEVRHSTPMLLWMMGLSGLYFSPDAAQELGIQGQAESIALQTIRQEVQTVSGASVSFHTSPADQPKKMFKVARAFTAKRLGLANHSYPLSILKKYQHLKDLHLQAFEKGMSSAAHWG
ncbi:hypothetical protein ROHU_015494 [Labeo rohita]|uniref:Uncharacterized protein n=1 Tax=Labeo rohita TaxID=84645 RepID=A0A498MXF7_LABRO|nr:hypothetical protein ROHU_021521 [Labeo rohita]RXN33434.1 hypothetical protein ROHU_015494 [Labeo rohita]